MPEFQVRPATAADLPQVQEVKHRAAADMLRRHGLTPRPAPTEADPHLLHLLQHHEGGGFWVAESGGQVIGYYAAILREGTWFLSAYWTLPEWQGQGVGRALARPMATAMGQARAAGVYASYDPPAMHTYLRLGMRPQPPFFRFTVPAATPLPPAPPWAGDVQRVPDLTPEVLAALGELDRQVRGCRRDVDHRFLRSFPDGELTLFTREGRVMAYAWVFGSSGRIGPVAWRDPGDLAPVLHTAVLRGQVLAGERATLSIPGSNTGAIDWCLARGLRLTDHRLFFASAGFGHMDRYVLAGPALL